MAFTQTDLDRIDSMIARGVLEADFPGGHRIKYNTMADMLRARRMIAVDINQQNGKPAYRKVTFQ